MDESIDLHAKLAKLADGTLMDEEHVVVGTYMHVWFAI